MVQNSEDDDIDYVRSRVLRKFPLLGVTMSSLKTVADDAVGRAGTDGENVYYSPKFFDTLSDDGKVFVYAHEVMHVAFNHILRSEGRNRKLWNTATDAVINQMLKNEGLPIVANGVDMPEAINLSAEEMYDILVESYNNTPQLLYGEEQAGHDDHGIWKKVVEQEHKDNSNADEIKNFQNNNFEKDFLSKNAKERQNQAEKIINSIEKRKKEYYETTGVGTRNPLGDVGVAKPIVSWKQLLRKYINQNKYRWSYRRSDASNDYMPRVEKLRGEKMPETEVMLDVSGSIDDELLREFLRQLKPIVKNSKLKVGGFDTRVFAFKEVKNIKDINHFPIFGGGGTDLDLAVRAFSKKKEVNKIVFTDGESRFMPEEDLQNVNVIWVVYNNKDFKPCCGKVIHVDAKNLKQNCLTKNMLTKKVR